MQGLLKPRSATCTMPLLPHSVVSSSHSVNPYSRKWKKQILPLDKRSCKITVQRVWIQGRGSHIGAGLRQDLCAICGKVRPWIQRFASSTFYFSSDSLVTSSRGMCKSIQEIIQDTQKTFPKKASQLPCRSCFSEALKI